MRECRVVDEKQNDDYTCLEDEKYFFVVCKENNTVLSKNSVLVNILKPKTRIYTYV